MSDPKFLADRMLGKVARWLIILGFDAAYTGTDGRSDRELLKQAKREERIFLTRDTKILEIEGLRMIVLRDQNFDRQMRQILRDCGLKLDKKRLFTRCTQCNAALNHLPRAEALPLVPELVKTLKTEFFRCPACSRIYWTGAHTDRTVKKLERMGLQAGRSKAAPA